MNRDEKFIFSAGAKKKLFITLGIGVVLFAIGVIMLATGSSHGDEHGHHAVVREGFHAEPAHAVTGDSAAEYIAQNEHLEGVHATNTLEDAAADSVPAGSETHERESDTIAEHAVAEDLTAETNYDTAHMTNADAVTASKENSMNTEEVKGHEADVPDHAPVEPEHHAEAAHGGGHHEAHWSLRIIKDLWLNNVFFAGISFIGLFFVAFNYVAWAGWSAGIKRIPEAFGSYLPIAGILTLLLIVVFHHELFHWTHAGLLDPNSPEYDELIVNKSGYLNLPFFIIRSAIFFIAWYGFWRKIRSLSIQEDLTGDVQYHHKMVIWSAAFIVVFGVTESMAAWDWMMSTDPHFFSTMFGWYSFASWFVSGLALITLIVVYLKENGYLSFINENHLHDLGKFNFAFSVFWTYVWFEQFLLIYYANIPEEVGYFVQRLKTDAYTPFFFAAFFINFIFPFLALMTRNAKRQGAILKVVCTGIIIGHWLDFYNMLTPPILGQKGAFDLTFLFLEVGMTMVFASVFLFVILTALSKVGLVAKNHPMLAESEHHSVF